MKKISTFLLTSLLCVVSVSSYAQSKKYVLFEHFTQASCGPCASQNPIFQSVAALNQSDIHHVAYHTSWPGVDPMYTANAAENDAATAFYGVSGVPSMTMLGNQWTGGPAAVDQPLIDGAKAPGSPISIKVTEVDMGATRDVAVTISTTGTIPAGSYVLRLAVVEQNIVYGSPPGTNGEMDFPNVFREYVANGQAGDAVTLAAIGSSITLNYSFTEDAGWDPTEIYTLGWIQNTSTKEILNSGASIDPEWAVTQPNGIVANGSTSVTSNLDSDIENASAGSNNFTVTLTASGAPAGWTADFTIGGTTYTSTASISIAGGATEAVVINVTPDAAAGIAVYTLSVENTSVPADPISTTDFNVMANVTDLIISNAGFGDGGSYDWEPMYLSGLAASGNTGYAATSTGTFKSFASIGLDPSVYNIYYNMGWTFPSFTDGLVADLTAFLDNGGRLFIAGQDIGWDTWDGTNGTATTQSFYTNYLNATYLGDGSPSNTSYDAVVADPIFGTVASGTISDVYGGGNLYPEEISPINGAVEIFNYNGGSVVGGIRAELAGYKVVYLGIGLEHLTGSIADDILTIAHDWFYGFLSTEEFDALMSLAQNFPNPATNLTTIPLPTLTENSTLRVVDYSGRVVFEKDVEVGATEMVISTESLESGMYIYSILNNDNVVTVSKTMEVIH